MDIRFTYDTYQDVRHNLFLYSLPFLIIAGFFAYLAVLPSMHQLSIVKLLGYISTQSPWKELLGTGVGITVFGGVAFLMTEIFQVHDQWYDRYVIRWRHQYAMEFILPRLVQPLACGLNYRFWEEAEIHTREFEEQLFYPFVGDRDLKIPKNKLVRFYEVVTPYWLTQINEIVLFVLACLVAIYSVIGPADLPYRTLMLRDSFILFIAFLLNRAWAQRCLSKVRLATEEEIRAIHDKTDLLADLKQRLKQICSNYNIPFRE